jgi:hypothetical protein
MKYEILEWIQRLSIPKEELGNMSICPYAKGATYELVETDGSDIQPPPWDFELIIYKLPDVYTQEELNQMAVEYNKANPLLVFLPDHKDRDTYINGIQTNNGKYNLLLCQWRDNLEIARNKLKKTNYYNYWADEYLKEILAT